MGTRGKLRSCLSGAAAFHWCLILGTSLELGCWSLELLFLRALWLAKFHRLSRLQQALEAAQHRRPAVIDASERGWILLDVLRQQVLMDQPQLHHLPHRRDFIRHPREALALFGDFRLVLWVERIDQLATRL